MISLWCRILNCLEIFVNFQVWLHGFDTDYDPNQTQTPARSNALDVALSLKSQGTVEAVVSAMLNGAVDSVALADILRRTGSPIAETYGQVCHKILHSDALIIDLGKVKVGLSTKRHLVCGL